nr:V-type ATP synthase subunit E family protein [Entomospira nematocera]
MDNEQAKMIMLDAIEQESRVKIAQLEREAQENRERLQQEMQEKITQLEEQSQQEILSTTARIDARMHSQLQSEVKRLALENHHRVMEEILQQVYQRIGSLMQTEAYEERLIAWTLDAIHVVSESNVYVRLGKDDIDIWTDAVQQRVIDSAKSTLAMTLNVELDPQGIHSGRGPIVRSQDGRKLCDNTIQARFSRERAQLSRMIATELF